MSLSCRNACTARVLTRNETTGSAPPIHFRVGRPPRNPRGNDESAARHRSAPARGRTGTPPRGRRPARVPGSVPDRGTVRPRAYVQLAPEARTDGVPVAFVDLVVLVGEQAEAG